MKIASIPTGEGQQQEFINPTFYPAQAVVIEEVMPSTALVASQSPAAQPGPVVVGNKTLLTHLSLAAATDLLRTAASCSDGSTGQATIDVARYPPCASISVMRN